MSKLELALCALLALAGLGHVAGTFAGYPIGSETFVWSLSATAFVFTIVFLHVLRIRRPQDRPIAAGAIVTTAAWIGLALIFGASIGAVGDPRVLIHVAVSLALFVTALRGWRASRPSRTAPAERACLGPRGPGSMSEADAASDARASLGHCGTPGRARRSGRLSWQAQPHQWRFIRLGRFGQLHHPL